MANNIPELDNELSDMTDELLKGQEKDVSAENQAEAQLVKQLYQMMNSQPDAAFRSRMNQKLNDEWATAFPHRTTRFPSRTLIRYGALAAAIIAVFALVYVATNLNTNLNTQGTALTPGDLAIPLIIALVGLIVVGIVYWRSRR